MAGLTPSVMPGIFCGAPAVTIPSGLIIPLNAAAGVPSGWSLFSDADGKYIIGAGDTYAADNNGAGTGNLSDTSSTNGAHTGTNFSISASSPDRGTASAGNHNHSLTWTYVPPYQEIRLIKADAETLVFPANGIVLAETDLSGVGLANVYTDEYLFKADSAAATGGSLTPSCTTGAGGDHYHGGSIGNADTGGPGGNDYENKGNHTHNFSMTMTDTMYKIALSAWTDAAAEFSLLTGMIGMWQGAVAPTGWLLCDGNGGTPDLRNHFVTLCATGNEDSGSGNGNVAWSGSTGNGGNHEHRVPNNGIGGGGNVKHSNSINMTGHTYTGSQVWLPAYYALTFVIKE